MAAQQQALQSEANVRHSEVMERQRMELVSESIASIEQQTPTKFPGSTFC